MTNLENEIKNVIEKKLSDGTVEGLIEKQLEIGIEKALENLLSGYNAPVKKVIEEQLQSTMVPFLEKYDYSEYIVKVDHVLTEVLKSTALDNKKTLENFKDLLKPVEIKRIKVSELFDKWTKFVAKEVSTDDLEIDYDDGPTYETVKVTMTVEEAEGREWSIYKHANIIFECEHDEDLNFLIPIHLYESARKETWTIDYKTVADISSLRYLKSFEVYLMALKQAFVEVELDIEDDEDDVTPEQEPEPSFS